MRSASRTARYATVMAVTRDALAGRDGVVFVDNFATLAGPGGGYVDAMQDPVDKRSSSGSQTASTSVRRVPTVWPTPPSPQMVAAWHVDLVRGSSPPTTAPPPTTTAPVTGRSGRRLNRLASLR